ncbi:amidohydrolase family protein [Pedobacter sp. L105]|uniref:amidohydrolase family protein n=1 Tax=Pedobacter sp. L105 TaxID=1641871 RepID=UPI00131D9247|nr:amidohydrolase family protein [Pedobacter sp. L105]
MKIIAIEEHLITEEIVAAWKKLKGVQDLSIKMTMGNDWEKRLLYTGEERIMAMDEAGIDVLVLSVTTPGVQGLMPDQAVELARGANDVIAQTIRQHPDRFQGFATLPTGAPDDAVRELKRAVRELGLNGAMLFGRTEDRHLDHPEFFSILEAAAEMHAPIYVHPQTPPVVVREAYYQGLGPDAEIFLAAGGFGWHYEAGLQVLRLIVSGVFEKLPDLQIILGHWGEVVLFYLDRIDAVSANLKLPRPISDYFRTNISITPGGIFSQRYLKWTIDVLGGVDRILFASDHPFNLSKHGSARRFLDEADLSIADKEKIAFGNWEKMWANIRR